MGLFSNEELDSLKDLAGSPGVLDTIDTRDIETVENLYWENPEETSDQQAESIRKSVQGFEQAKGPGINRDFEDAIPALYHKTRSKQARKTDEALDAKKADTWQEYVANPDEYDWPGVDTKR